MHNFARDFDNEELQIAAMIHPKFKTSWIPENKRARKYRFYKKFLMDLSLQPEILGKLHTINMLFNKNVKI